MNVTTGQVVAERIRRNDELEAKITAFTIKHNKHAGPASGPTTPAPSTPRYLQRHPSPRPSPQPEPARPEAVTARKQEPVTEPVKDQ